MIFSANYFGMDEDAGALDGERILDRIAAIPFGEWDDMAANDFAAKQRRFKAVVDSPEKPTEFLIGEIGDFIRSEEFSMKRDEFANILYEKAEECIKIRTLGTNYSSFFAILWKFHQIFQPVWEEMDASWDGFMDWTETVFAPFLIKQHQEKDHSKHSIRRYVNDVLSFILLWSILDRRKILKICETKKLKNGQKYCLAFHPSPRYVDFQEMGGVRLKDLKAHTNAIGGAWGDDTWAAMVRDNCEAVLDTTEDGADGLEDTQAKRAILIPINVFTSSQIMKIATLTGQTEDYKKFGVDEETPSGVEDIRNSTQRSGSSYNLVLSDVSSIQAHEEDEGQGILFEEIERPTENVLEETNETSDNHDDNDDVNAAKEDTEIDDASIDESVDRDDIDFVDPRKKSLLSKTLKAKKPSRDITVVEVQEKTFFVCPCGFSSTNKSGSSRHKCRSVADVAFACKDCDKICRNPGSLKRHIQSMHRNRQSVSLPVFSANQSFNPISSRSQITEKEAEHKCVLCSKILKTQKNLQNHIDKVHGKTAGTSADATEASTHKATTVSDDDVFANEPAAAAVIAIAPKTTPVSGQFFSCILVCLFILSV